MYGDQWACAAGAGYCANDKGARGGCSRLGRGRAIITDAVDLKHLAIGVEADLFGGLVQLVRQPRIMDLTHGMTLVANQKLRSEEHTSELQSRGHLVCRLLLEKKKFT